MIAGSSPAMTRGMASSSDERSEIRNQSSRRRHRSRISLCSSALRCCMMGFISLNPHFGLLMFNRKTALIIGAGASAEFNMPVGTQLMSQIADLLRFGTARSDPRFRGQMFEFLGKDRAVQLEAASPRLLSLISRFDSMDEVLHFLSDDLVSIELGKIAIAYQILKAERNSILVGALSGNREATDQCDSSWANGFLRIALSATRRQDYGTIFRNVTVIDFNYDRVLPQYLYSALQRLYGFAEAEARGALGGLKILHPYGSLGPLEWEGEQQSLPFASENDDPTSAGRIRTYTEETSNPETKTIKQVINEARIVLVLGFGFHNQNIKLLTTDRAELHIPAFMTVAGIGGHNHEAVAEKMRTAIRSFEKPQCLAEPARSFINNLRVSISLAAS